MVRKREKFKKSREMPRLTGSAVLVITVVIVVCFILALFSTGIIQPYLSGRTTTALSAVNTAQDAIPQSTLFNDYRTSPTYAAVNYTQQWVYALANVSSVEKGTGVYQSCVGSYIIIPFRIATCLRCRDGSSTLGTDLRRHLRCRLTLILW